MSYIAVCIFLSVHVSVDASVGSVSWLGGFWGMYLALAFAIAIGRCDVFAKVRVTCAISFFPWLVPVVVVHEGPLGSAQLAMAITICQQIPK